MPTTKQDTAADGTLVTQVVTALRRQISSRQATPGEKLPSIRALATRLSVSKSTVVEAYDRLAAEGVVEARPGSGFYVAGHTPPLSLSDVGPRLDRAIDPLWMTRQSLGAQDNLLLPGCGWLPASWLPQDDIRRGLRALARAPKTNLTDYSTPHGSLALRQLLSRRLADRQIEATPDQIMLTESGTQAIDLLCRFLLEPGDTVLLDDPCYFNFHAMLRAHRVQVVGVPYTPTGPNTVALEAALIAHKPRLYITNSALHNPTGAVLSPVVAHRVLTLAEQHDMLVIEDDIFADFEQDPAPRLAAFDGLNRVLHISSFSKTLSAATRCGFIATRPDWVEELIDLRLATAFGGGAFSSELVLGLLKDGAYRRHLAGLRRRLAQARGTVGARLRAMGVIPWIEPTAGMFLWCALPDGLEAGDVARRALVEGIVLAPGNAFRPGHGPSNHMRFNVAQCGSNAVFEGLERAMRAHN